MPADIDQAVRDATLPEGITLLDGAGFLLLAPGPTNGLYRPRWIAYLSHLTPATGPEGQGIRLFVHPIDFGPVRTFDPTTIPARMAAEAATFQKDLAAGAAQEIHDGELLPAPKE